MILVYMFLMEWIVNIVSVLNFGYLSRLFKNDVGIESVFCRLYDG
jgi:hypothetical protein